MINEPSGKTTAASILTDLNRLIVMRHINDKPVFAALRTLLNSLISNSPMSATDAYYTMTAELIRSKSRRVSGNLFTDYILYELLECENAFSLMAAREFLDPSIYAAMKIDVDILLNLTHLNSGQIHSWVERTQESTPDHVADKISIMSDAAWGGSRPRISQVEAARASTARTESSGNIGDFLPWDYGEFELRDTYSADYALEEIYLRCLSDDRCGLIEDLWNFFDACGTGDFLHHRCFEYDKNQSKLIPMNMPVHPIPDFPCLYSDIHSMLIDDAISFMRDDIIQNVMIVGSDGLGKTSMLFTLVDELPEVRLILLRGSDLSAGISNVIEVLRNQPLKFVLAIDGADGCIGELSSYLLSGLNQPRNVLICATTVSPSPSALFSTVLTLENAQLNDFSSHIYKYMMDNGIEVEMSAVQNACMDYQLETHLPFSYQAALRIIQMFK